MKIAFIGGGSLEWTPILMTDMALTPELDGSTIVLHDVREDTLALMHRVSKLICKEAGTTIRVEATTDRERAVDGADYVLYSIGVGELEAHRVDLEVPARYGMAQPVGVSVGPGGINRALRHIPVTLDLCRDMERLCPDAWLVNVTNPMTQICWAATQESNVRTVGLCHGTTSVRRDLAAWVFDIPIDQVWIKAAGINHLAWITEMKVAGEDGLARLENWLDEHGPDSFKEKFELGTHRSVFRDRMAVKFRIFQATGALPGIGDRHLVEFYPHFVREGTRQGLDYGVELTTIEHRYQRKAAQRRQVESWLSGEEPVPLKASFEQAAPVMAALSGGRSDRFIINIPNGGQVTNLPDGAIVEIHARVDGDGIHPEHFGELPPAAAAVAEWHLQEMALTIEAAKKGDVDLALQAVRMDPLVRDWELATRLLEELMAGTAEYLPQFSRQ